jgi:hypothetical protein
MFARFSRSRPGSSPVAEEQEGSVMEECVPLAVLQLELRDGWSLDLGDVEVVEDDIGRRAVSRVDARRLLAEYRERAEREAECLRRHREETERAAVEADQRFRAQLHPGIPHGAFGDVDPVLAQIAAEIAADPRRRSMQELQDARFGRSAGDAAEFTYHPIRSGEDG